MSKMSGGCACGAIRYETDADPAAMVNCHCRDCQRTTGSGYAAVMMVPKAAMTTKGEPRYYKTVGEAGLSVERGFCPACGSPVFARLARLPDLIGIHAASLDDPSLYQPGMELFTESAQSWHVMHPKTEKRPRGFTN